MSKYSELEILNIKKDFYQMFFNITDKDDNWTFNHINDYYLENISKIAGTPEFYEIQSFVKEIEAICSNPKMKSIFIMGYVIKATKILNKTKKEIENKNENNIPPPLLIDSDDEKEKIKDNKLICHKTDDRFYIGLFEESSRFIIKVLQKNPPTGYDITINDEFKNNHIKIFDMIASCILRDANTDLFMELLKIKNDLHKEISIKLL